MAIKTITVPTITVLGMECDSFELLRQKANQLDALTHFCDQSLDSIDGSYRDYVLSAVNDIAFEVRQLAELINDSQPRSAA